MSDIPDWAIKRVCEIVNKDGSTYSHENFFITDVFHYSIAKAFARYIAQHEQPPRDRVWEVADRLVQSYDGLHMDWMAEAMADAMRKALPAAAIKAIEEMGDDRS